MISGVLRNFLLYLLPPFFLLTFFTSAHKVDGRKNNDWLKSRQQLEASTIVLNNEKAFLPLQNLEKRRIASLSLGEAPHEEFNKYLNKYALVQRFPALDLRFPESLDKLNTDLKLYNTLILRVTEKALGDSKVKDFIFRMDADQSRDLILLLSGDVNSLKYLDQLQSPIIFSNSLNQAADSYLAQLVFGGVKASGRLPRTVSARFKQGDGEVAPLSRLSYTVPEELGLNSDLLESSIDQIVKEAIAAKATPAAAVMVIKDGKVIFDKAYGSHTYNSSQKTTTEDIFDLASVTKISATTIAAMKLYEEGKLHLDSTLDAYLPLAKSTNKKDLKLRELLLHEAGLTPYIPFYQSLKPGEFSRDSSAYYSVKVADRYYLKKNFYEEVMLPRMLNAKVQPKGRYEYSDLSMYFMKEAIERQAVEPLDQYVEEFFYRPLGMKTAGFNPRLRFTKERIVPTEQDNVFRKTLLEGYVHDQGAAMAGGVAGHAGLFASTNDLAILFQMILNGGTYGGKRYFSPETINLFTGKQSKNSRRGLGFDGWDPAGNGYPSKHASPLTYGHTGYTGTCVWVDPKYNLIYIFLSNRVHPQVSNKLSSLQIRPRIQDAIYEAIGKVEK